MRRHRPPSRVEDGPRTHIAPPLKWAGGKRWQVPRVREMWVPHAARRFVEPFCGGLAVALGLMPDRALLNDVNPHLINFYRWLQRGLRVTIPLENDGAAFYRNRLRFNQLVDASHPRTSESAALFYYLNRTAYNGLCRFNRRGHFNVPFGRYRRINYVRDFSGWKDAFAGWTFTSTDFARVPLGRDDFVYADPPYDVEFTSYSRGAFGWKEQVRAAEWLAAHAGPVILVNQATDRIIRLYTALDFSLTFLQAPRRISCTGDRRPAREVLATRNL